MVSIPARHPLRRARNFVWLLPALGLLALFVYYPLVETVRLTFFSWSAFNPIPRFVGLDNYRRAIEDPIFWSGLRNNLYYVATSVVVQVGGGLVLAGVIEEFVKPRWRGFLRSVYFLPATLSVTICGMLFQFLYHPQLGLIDAALRAVGLGGLASDWLGKPATAIWGIILMSQWQFTGYVTALFVVAIQRIPREYYEAAAIDGASRIRTFFVITVPLVREMTALMTIFTVSGAFLVFNQVMAMTSGGPNNSSQVLGTWMYQSAFQNNRMGYAAVIATVILLLTLIASSLQLWYTARRRVAF